LVNNRTICAVQSALRRWGLEYHSSRLESQFALYFGLLQFFIVIWPDHGSQCTITLALATCPQNHRQKEAKATRLPGNSHTLPFLGVTESSSTQGAAEKFCLIPSILLEECTCVAVEMASARYDEQLLWLPGLCVHFQGKVCRRQAIILRHHHEERCWRDVFNVARWVIGAKELDAGVFVIHMPWVEGGTMG